MATEISIPFDVDLLSACQAEYDFLFEIQGLECLQNEAVLKNAIRRYETLWLPLVASCNILSECLVPPVDIAWVWHCHMLSPHNYASYCKLLFGKVLDHSVTKSTIAPDITKSLWSSFYPDEPFDFDSSITEANIPQVLKHQSKSDSFDLLKAIHRQQDFFYNIHLPHYRDMMFLDGALKRYKKYLFLKKKNPAEFLVPCYDIDLVWHTHQLHPIDYERVTKSLLGHLLIHDDTDSDRKPGSKISNAFERTRILWREEYQEAFASHGAMYRGESPKDRLYQLTKSDIKNISGRNAKIIITDIKLISPHEVAKIDVKFKVYKTNVSQNPCCIQKLTSKIGNMNWNNQTIECSYDHTDSTLVFELASRTAFGKGSKIIGGFQERFGLFLLKPEFQNGGNFKFERNLQMVSTISAAKCTVAGSIERPSLAGIVLFLETGTFKEANIPTNEDQFWGLVPVSKSDAKNICQVATHRLRNANGNVVFTCRIIHSVSVMTSVIQVFFHDKLAAVAHVIGADQLPMKSQISSPGITFLNPSAGERAVLVKTGRGDSMIIAGKWFGFLKGKEGAIDRPSTPGNPGHLKVKINRVISKILPKEEIIHLSQYHPLQYEGLTLDFNKGILSCSELETKKIVEYVAFSFSVALLDVLCVPRPAGWKPGDSLQQKLVKRGRRNVERFPDYDMSFMVAAGLLTLTPSNHYLYHNDNTDTSTDRKCCTFDLRQCVIDSNTDYLLSNGTALEGVCGACGGCGGCGGYSAAQASGGGAAGCAGAGGGCGGGCGGC